MATDPAFAKSPRPDSGRGLRLRKRERYLAGESNNLLRRQTYQRLVAFAVIGDTMNLADATSPRR
jgi:hypothetical protein